MYNVKQSENEMAEPHWKKLELEKNIQVNEKWTRNDLYKKKKNVYLEVYGISSPVHLEALTTEKLHDTPKSVSWY